MAILTNEQFIAVGVTAAAGLFYLHHKRKKLIDSVNPASPNNLINQGAQTVIGKENLQNGFDQVFARIDLLNPFATPERKRFARGILNQE